MDLRPATWQDRHTLYQWRHHEEETATWWEGNPVTMESHNTWLRARLKSPTVELWIAEDRVQEVDGRGNLIIGKWKRTPVGMVRIDSNGEVSVSIDPAHRKQGYGTKLLREACRVTSQSRLKASVDEGNLAARRLFEKAGFTPRPDVLFYLKRLP